MKYQIIQGDNRETLKNIADNSIDAIVTDPPYGIDFLGKAWDVNTGELETYEECLRVLKPGGYILAFSAARTYHHLAMTLERAGFEIRDQIMWIYSSGFPKSQDIGKQIQKKLGVKETKPSKGMNVYAEVKDKKGKEKWMNPGNITTDDYPEKKDEVVVTDPEALQWAGWGTALKPAHEPIALARKPVKGSIKDNVQKWGTGGLNIDATRIPFEDKQAQEKYAKQRIANANQPPNPRKTLMGSFATKAGLEVKDKYIEPVISESGRFPSNVIGEILQEDYQKYFYCPKVSRKERHIGIDNNHPTVKPITLMEYLIKLITPPGGTVLDPFNGSGSTGMAATGLGLDYIGLELDPNYVKITEQRIGAWLAKDDVEVKTTSTFKELFE